MIRALGLAVGLLVAMPAVAAAADQRVDITDRLRPAEVAVAAGETVTWTNHDRQRHRVRSTDAPQRLDSGNLEPGESWAHTFTAAGVYRYADARDDDNRRYHGVVTVAGGDDGGVRATGGAGDVSLADETFTPGQLRVRVGETVTWVNDDDDEHTVTAMDGSFDSGELERGARFTHTFDAPATVDYLCALHAGMRGTVVVGGGSPGGGGHAGRSPAEKPAKDTPAGTDAGVEIRDFRFAPADLKVPSGTTVTWQQTGDAPHTVTADGGEFDSGIIDAGGSFAHTFDEAGTYAYLCSLHPQMAGTVTVTADGAGKDAAARPAVVATGTPTADDPLPAVAAPALLATPAAAAQPGPTALLPLLAGLALLSAAVVFAAWRIERAVRAVISRDAPRPADRRPVRT
ncbi:MAG TPA: plastocyanin/azurin family copper-binding protein [Egibacteraceae bacterium]|nr:plastocyanin/azurin family copper-binding protein [Egibacteraceae bacterium]